MEQFIQGKVLDSLETDPTPIQTRPELKEKLPAPVRAFTAARNAETAEAYETKNRCVPTNL